MPLKDNVATNLRAWRQRRKTSQEKLAGKTGISLSYISEIERHNRQPTLDVIEKLAEGLGIPPQRLLAEPAQ